MPTIFNIDMAPIFVNAWHIPTLIGAIIMLFMEELIGLKIPPVFSLLLVAAGISISWYWQFKKRQVEYKKELEELEHLKKMNEEQEKQAAIVTLQMASNEPKKEA